MSPAELQMGRKLQSPMDKLLQGKSLSPSIQSYDVVHQKKAQKRQLRNYIKNRREASFEEKSRVWLRNFLQSSAQHNFSVKLAPKWKGPYRVLKRLGRLNYQIALEETGEDVRTAHVCNLKPCYPKSGELESQERGKLLQLFQQSSDDEELLCF